MTRSQAIALIGEIIRETGSSVTPAQVAGEIVCQLGGALQLEPEVVDLESTLVGVGRMAH